jgi:hypothetical protein
MGSCDQPAIVDETGMITVGGERTDSGELARIREISFFWYIMADDHRRAPPKRNSGSPRHRNQLRTSEVEVAAFDPLERSLLMGPIKHYLCPPFMRSRSFVKAVFKDRLSMTAWILCRSQT